MSDEKRSRGEVALFRVIKSKVEEEMEKEDKVKEEHLVKNTWYDSCSRYETLKGGLPFY